MMWWFNWKSHCEPLTATSFQCLHLWSSTSSCCALADCVSSSYAAWFLYCVCERSGSTCRCSLVYRCGLVAAVFTWRWVTPHVLGILNEIAGALRTYFGWVQWNTRAEVLSHLFEAGEVCSNLSLFTGTNFFNSMDLYCGFEAWMRMKLQSFKWGSFFPSLIKGRMARPKQDSIDDQSKKSSST